MKTFPMLLVEGTLNLTCLSPGLSEVTTAAAAEAEEPGTSSDEAADVNAADDILSQT